MKKIIENFNLIRQPGNSRRAPNIKIKGLEDYQNGFDNLAKEFAMNITSLELECRKYRHQSLINDLKSALDKISFNKTAISVALHQIVKNDIMLLVSLTVSQDAEETPTSFGLGLRLGLVLGLRLGFFIMFLFTFLS